MPLEVPYTSPQSRFRLRPYNGRRSLGDAAPATCPTRPLWWLLVAAAAGAVAGFKLTDAKKKRRRA